MKPAAFATAVLMVMCITCPAPLHASQRAEDWRKRISSDYDTEAMLDITEEIRFGREVAARIIARYGLDENLPIMKYVNLVGQALAGVTNRPEIEFHFAVLNSDEINAFAAPGGYVFVTRGALRAMRDEAELAGVIAHEMGHIAEKHVVRELKVRGAEKEAVAGMAQAIGGSTDPARVAFEKAVEKAMNILFKDGYKRKDEIQADKDAIVLCAIAGYEPSGLVRYLQRINGIKGKQTEVLYKTHPSYEERIARIKTAINQDGLGSDNFRTFQKRFDEYMNAVK